MAPRVEMLPLIDVVFLLLTFFIYSMTVMISAQVLPVTLTPLQTGTASRSNLIHTITIDQRAEVYFNRELVTEPQLEQRLDELTKLPEPPTVYLAIEAGGAVDRGPRLIRLLEQVQAKGITNIALVGAP